MAQQRNIKKVVLAYSGGLDTSVILKWLQVNYGCEVITMTADVGQEDDLNGVDEKALRTGATKAYIEDLREEFAKDFIFPMLRSGALYEGRYLLGTSVARPLITKRLVEIARAEGADALAHGATGKGNDQVRFELSAAALAPDLRVIAPWREWDLMSRTALNFFAEQHNIPISSGAKHYSMDRNMLHCSFEGGELEDPWEEPLEASHIMAVPFEKAPDEAEYVTITFEHGDPVAVKSNFRRLNENRFMSKGMDDKVGAFIVAETMRRLSERKLNVAVYGVGTVQEEVGLRGAHTSCFGVDPQVGFAIDVGFATDLPDIPKKLLGEVKLGGGPELSRSCDNNNVLGRYIRKVAKEKGIAYQETAAHRASGGTDAAQMQMTRAGVATAPSWPAYTPTR